MQSDSRIAVLGSPGSGKTTLSVRLGQLLGLPVHHLDDLYWHEGWTPTPAAEWRAVVEELVARDRWIIDGNYADVLDVRIRAADTVVLLDVPPAVCVVRVLRRYIAQMRGDRTGLPARIRDSGERRVAKDPLAFLRFVATFRSAVLPRMQRIIVAAPVGRRVVTLRSTADVERFLASVAGRSGGVAVPRPAEAAQENLP
ncbi:AAA family ATPase [Sorangium sp. So ce1182]|uniref:AAA family ATPase n=1 Tax=Sorangium sp. So ce1182 TaxID=3133334 RepID=UPI003F60BD20